MKICEHCGEEIKAGEAQTRFIGVDLHHECGFRLIAGSVAHIEKRCTCWDGCGDDPPGLTKRQAAQAALELWLKLNPRVA